MIKNIILFFLAICFILLIISYILNINQLKLWDSSIIEGATTLDNALIANSKNTISSKVIDEIEVTLGLQNGSSETLPTNIIQNAMAIQVYDAGWKSILENQGKTDIVRIEELKKYVQYSLKPKLSADGLILHYTLDSITGGVVKNIAPETMGESKYDGNIYGAQIDTSDYVYGKGCIRFRYDSSKQYRQSDYIQIPSIPTTFYDEGGIFDGFTFATWYQNTSNSKPWARLFEFAVGGGGNHTILASVNFGWDTNYTFVVHGSDKNEFNISMTNQQIPVNKWIHVATTISKNGTYTNYINGVATPSNYSTSMDGLNLGTGNAVSTNVWGGVVDPDTKAVRVPSNYDRSVNYIGKSAWWSGDSGFDGRMNDFRIYRKALTANDIMNIYKLRNPIIPYSFSNLKIQINAKRENVVLNPDGTTNTFKDKSGNNNSGEPRGDIQYCPRNQIITIPTGQYLEIKNNRVANTEFTIAIVANVKTFNPQSHYNVNYLFGSSLCANNQGALEAYITNNKLICGTSCLGPVVQYNLANFKGDAVNIYVIKMDSNNNISISINGKPCITSQNLPHNWINSGNILIARGPTSTWWDSNGRWWSSDTMDFHEFMYITEHYSTVKQQSLEGYLANTWGLINSLPTDHPSRI